MLIEIEDRKELDKHKTHISFEVVNKSLEMMDRKEDSGPDTERSKEVSDGNQLDGDKSNIPEVVS